MSVHPPPTITTLGNGAVRVDSIRSRILKAKRLDAQPLPKNRIIGWSQVKRGAQPLGSSDLNHNFI